MSSSPRRAPASPLAAIAPLPTAEPEVLPFPYADASAARPQPGTPSAEREAPARPPLDPANQPSRDPERDAKLHQAGRQQGAVEARAKFEEQLTIERAAIAKALADFARERASYYKKIEEEAVQLALAIARKVIHREAQVDPLLLLGIVRVALERIEGATGVALLVPPQQAAEWRKHLSSFRGACDLPEIVEDPAVLPHDCILRTSMGTAQLGLEVQLKEIETGLMDLLAARPGGQS